ncbi:MAG: hypothetical protein ACM3YE_02565 [Bacteroidota bacterium]
MRTSIKAIIFILLFVIANPAYTIDYSIYTPSTIYLEFTRIETDHQPKAGQRQANILIHPIVPFSIFAEYLGQERKLSEDNQKSLAVFAKTFSKPFALDIYKYEILVRDSDNHEYWLPIQENFREAFHNEYYNGCKLTLYLLISIIYDHKPLVLINEFWVQ